MALVSSKAMLLRAMRDGYAVGHFNVSNLETVQAVIEAAQEKKSPVIVAVTESSLNFAGFEYLVSLVKIAAGSVSVPVVLHLDHGRDQKIIRRCIDSGFTSVMCDASFHPFERNVAITKQVADRAHKRGIPVEGELGTVTQKMSGLAVEQKRCILTDPVEAKHYVKRTGIDSLAVAIGTSHGAYKFSGSSELDIERLRLIDQMVRIPLVLHGASEIPAAVVKKAIKFHAHWHGAKGLDMENLRLACRNGINKVNIHTDLSLVYLAATMEYLAKHRREMDERKLLTYARDQMKEFVKRKIDILGSANKA